MKYYYPLEKQIPESEQNAIDKLFHSVSNMRACSIEGDEVDLKSYDSKVEKLIKLGVLDFDGDLFEIVDRNLYNIFYSILLTFLVRKNKRQSDQVIEFARKNSVRFLSYYQSNKKRILEAARCNPSAGTMSMFLHSILYICMSEFPDFFHQMMQQVFKKAWKHVSMGDEIDFSLVCPSDWLYSLSILYFLEMNGEEFTDSPYVLILICALLRTKDVFDFVNDRIPDSLTAMEKRLVRELSANGFKLGKEPKTAEAFKRYSSFFDDEYKSISKTQLSVLMLPVGKESFESTLPWAAFLAGQFHHQMEISQEEIGILFHTLLQYGSDAAPPESSDDAKKLSSLMAENELLKNKLSAQETEISSLKKKLSKAEKKSIHNTADAEREIAKLREEVAELENLLQMQAEAIDDMTADQDTEEEKLTASPQEIQQMIETLNKYSCAVVGGQQVWTSRMRKQFPKWFFYPEGNVKFQKNQKLDLVIIITKHVSHKMYYKVLSACKSRKLKKLFISGSNIELNTMQIYEYITREEVHSEAE